MVRFPCGHPVLGKGVVLSGLVAWDLPVGSGLNTTIISSVIIVVPDFYGELLLSKYALHRALHELPHFILTAPWGGDPCYSFYT